VIAPDLRDIALRIAAEQQLPPALVLAVVEVESGGDVCAWRAEPAYRYLWDVVHGRPFRRVTASESASETPPWDFYTRVGSRTTEWWGQQASWGPMQIMGAVAREYGFAGHFPNLCGVHGVHYAATHMAMLRDRFLSRYGWPGVVAAYNAGSVRWADSHETRFTNQTYVDKITQAGGLD